MKTSAIIRIIAWSLTAIILTLLFTSLMLGNGVFGIDVSRFHLPFSINGSAISNYSNGDSYTAGGSSVPGDGISSLDINWNAGSVTVIPYSGSDIRFSESADGDISEDAMLHWLSSSGKLTIQYCKAGFNKVTSIRSKDLTVEIPAEKYFSDFSVDCVSASASVSGVSSGAFDADTISGSFSLTGGQFSSMDVETISGRVMLDSITTGTLDADSVSGSLTLSGSASEMDYESISGAFTADLDVCPVSFDADTTSGKVDLYIPSDSSFTAELSSVSGSKSCGFPVSTDGNRMVCGNGFSQFEINTISGDITIGQK